MSRALLSLSVLAALGGCVQTAPASSRIDLDLVDASAADVFRLLGQVTAQDFIVPACAADRWVDLTLKNVAPELVLEVLEHQLGLTYRDVEGATLVACVSGLGGVPRDVLDQRVSLDVSGASSEVLLQLLARQAGLSGARLEAASVSVSLSLTDVRLETALLALQESARLAEVTVEDNILVGRALRPLTDAPLDRVAITDTIEEILAAPLDCPSLADRKDRAVIGFIADAEGRISQAWALEIDAPDALAGCLVDEVASWVVADAGPPVAYVEFPPPAVAHHPAPARR